ncbi:hypothetical protein [Kluyvera sichuanensis]|uniref:hypothetical protein n=1 Tax=Kluyvera sichuanensis TaxID=2725494 RepID=UPI0039F4CA27
MHIEWMFVLILIVLFIALIREVVKAERRALDLEVENLKLQLKVNNLERGYSCCSRELRQQNTKIESVQSAIGDLDKHPENMLTNLCQIGLYMEKFFSTEERFDLNKPI